MNPTKELLQVQKTSRFDMIMANLGLTVTDLAAIQGRVLDFGCGPEAAFTKALRAMGIEADGVDMNLETEAPYLMEAYVDHVGAVPQPDGAYELIVAHFVPGVYMNNQPFIDGFFLAGRDIDLLGDATQSSLQEVIRLLHPKGKAIACPGLLYAPQDTLDALTSKGITYETERITDGSIIELLATFHGIPEPIGEVFTSRTTLRYE